MGASTRISGTRAAIALFCCCAAGIAVVMSLFSLIALADDHIRPARALVVVAPAFAWISLAVMTVRWLQDRRCHWIWPVVGTVAGAVCTAVFHELFILFGAAVPLAVYLAIWHLRPSSKRSAGSDQG